MTPGGGPAVAGSTSNLVTEAARAAAQHWSQIDLDPHLFEPYLTARLPAGSDPAAALRSLAVADLYLACACVEGIAEAHRELERYYPAVREALARARLSETQCDEVVQQLREHLLLPSAAPSGTEAPPSLARYSGKGPLSRWLRVVAVRLAFRYKPAELPRAEDSLALVRAATDAPTPEMALLEARCLPAINAAFRASFAELPLRQRNMLRHRHADGLTMEEIGVLYELHHTSVCRELARAHQTLVKKLRKRLRAELGVGAETLESILKLMQTRIEATIHEWGYP